MKMILNQTNIEEFGNTSIRSATNHDDCMIIKQNIDIGYRYMK